MSRENQIRELPVNIPVKLCVEKVWKKQTDDSHFSLECRVCDGDEVGKMMNIHFFRTKKAGGERKDTTRLLETLCPGKPAAETPSYLLQGKIFETTPWHPENSRFQMFTKFKYIGVNEDVMPF